MNKPRKAKGLDMSAANMNKLITPTLACNMIGTHVIKNGSISRYIYKPWLVDGGWFYFCNPDGHRRLWMMPMSRDWREVERSHSAEIIDGWRREWEAIK